jgi:hypothetical protein
MMSVPNVSIVEIIAPSGAVVGTASKQLITPLEVAFKSQEKMSPSAKDCIH